MKQGELITGCVDVDKRSDIIKRFQDGSTKVLLCTVGAASTGYTMTAASKVVFNDMSYVPGDNEQAYSRLWRIGQTGKVFVYYIGGSKVDSGINQTLQEKVKTIKIGVGDEA